MSERPIAEVGPVACPFVAFEHDQARRSVEPDRRHRCYAEPVPAPRAISHQSTYCLSSSFSACPTFRAWAQRAAAQQEAERQQAARAPREVPVAPMPQAPDPAAMGLVTDDARPSVQAADGDPRAAEPAPGGAPGWATPPPWSSGTDEGDDELASLVRGSPATGTEPDDDVPAFLAGRPPASNQAASSGTAGRKAGAGGAAAAAPSEAAGPGGTPSTARPRGVGQARPATRSLRRPVRVDNDAPAWETPRRFEAYPTLRTRVGLPRLPGLAIAIVAVLGAALLLLVLPSIVAGPSATPTPTASPSELAEPTITAEPSPTPQVYVIAAGDTLNKIARKFSTTIEDLLAANPQITNPNRIQVGDEIVIPAPVTEEPSVEASPEEAAPSP